MEHMKRMLVMVVAVVMAGAALMYVHRHMYKNCGEDVKVQSMPSGVSRGYKTPNSHENMVYDKEHRSYEKNQHRSKPQAPTQQE